MRTTILQSLASLRRAVAQLGSALEWGSRGRGFESRQPESQYQGLTGLSDKNRQFSVCIRFKRNAYGQ